METLAQVRLIADIDVEAQDDGIMGKILVGPAYLNEDIH